MTPPEIHLPHWYCLRAQTKREHIAAGHLREIEAVEVFCPRIRYRKATRRGKIWWVEPLFPGYLLAKFDIYEMERAVTFCQGVRGLVRFGSEIPPVPDAFVDSLREEVHSRSAASQPAHSLDSFNTCDDGELFSVSPIILVGDEVEIAHGPLQGMQGTILSVAPATERVKILLDFIGQPQAVDVDLFSLLLPRRPAPPIPATSIIL